MAALAAMRLPALEALLARLDLVHDDTQSDATLSPPHERAHAEALGIGAADGCIPWAALEARRLGLPVAGEHDAWGVATLCHWQVGIDDVVLGDPSAIDIDAGESAALLATVRPFFEEDGIALHPSSVPGRWLARGPVFEGLATASVDRAVGFPIAHWSPLTVAARPLRRLQNEMQMLLYTDRVNDERSARGVLPINSFWLSGTGRLPQSATSGDRSMPEPIVDATLRIAALRDDGAAWAAAWQALDTGTLADLLAASARGEAVALTLCGDRSAQRFGTVPRGLMRRARDLFRRASVQQTLEAL